MGKINFRKRMFSLFVITAVVFYGLSYCYDNSLEYVSAEQKQEYLLVTDSRDAMEELSQKHDIEIIAEDTECSDDTIAISSLTSREVDELQGEQEIVAIEKDVQVKASGVKNGRRMIRKKKKSDTGWNMQMIRGQKENMSQGNDKVKVAILDSGIDYANDIEIEKSINLVSDEEISPLFIDITGHGSSVAGIIAAQDNDEGITGINPNVQIYSAKVLDDDNTAPVSRVIEGIYWAIEQDVNIINISFGTSTRSVALEKAIQDAYNAGILIIAAAGNTGAQVEYPAAYEEVMSVGAVNSSGEDSDFSAGGDELEIVAPGEKVPSTGGFGGTVICSGTSMSAPHVAGVASLIWQKDITVSNEFVRGLLNASANSYGEKEDYGNGLLDADRALELYDQYKQEYEKSGSLDNMDYVPEENCKDVYVFDTEDYVEGSWTGTKHEGLMPTSGLTSTEVSIIKTGAIYPDSDRGGVKGLGAYPEWHGGYKSNNYIGNYIYVTSLARALKNNTPISTVYCPGVVSATEKSNLYNAVARLPWSDLLATPSSRNKSLFVWGMALHTATDVYAHSAWADVYCKIDKQNKWEHLDHGDHNGKADDASVKPNRYETAAEVVKVSIKRWFNGDIGSVLDFDPGSGYVNAGTNWTIKKLSDNARSLGCGSSTFNRLYTYSEAPQYHSYK